MRGSPVRRSIVVAIAFLVVFAGIPDGLITSPAYAAPLRRMLQRAQPLAPGSTERAFATATPQQDTASAPANTAVRLPSPLLDTAGIPADANSVLLRRTLNNALRYALTVWYGAAYGRQPASGYLDLNGTDEAHIKGAAMQAYGLAVALRTGAYDATATGVTNEQANAVAVRLAVSVAAHHVANQGGGWGNGWQTAVWTADAATAAWLLWDQLAPADRTKVLRMLTFEADRFLNYTVPYYADVSGNIVSPGDTKAEENAWNATVLELSSAMLPASVHATQWRRKAAELLISSYARPESLTNTQLVNGQPLNTWINGSNADPQGLVVNHGIVHDDYIASATLKLDGPLYDGLAGIPALNAALLDLPETYGALSRVQFSAPPYLAPGGSMYVKDSGDLYYPQGDDWGTGRRANLAGLDVLASAFGLDQVSDGSASYWATLHLSRQLALQDRSADGRTYQSPQENTYALREEMVTRDLTDAWLGNWEKANSLVQFTNAAIAPPSSPSAGTALLAWADRNRHVNVMSASVVQNWGGTATSVPSVAISPSGTVFVVVRGSDGRMYVRTAGTGWAPIAPTGSCSDPDAAATSSRIYFACRGAHAELEAGSAPIGIGLPVVTRWSNLGGYLASGPVVTLPRAAAVAAPTYLVVGHSYKLATGSANTYSRTDTTTWSAANLNCAGPVAASTAGTAGTARWLACPSAGGMLVSPDVSYGSAVTAPGGRFELSVRPPGRVGLVTAGGQVVTAYLPGSNGYLQSTVITTDQATPPQASTVQVGTALTASSPPG